jgi:hypothetical protein
MKKEKVSEIISTIDDKYIDEATMYAVDHVHDAHASHEISAKKRTRRIRWNIVAACLALFIVIGSTAVALAVEAKEYHAAATFFESNGLSTDGLSRSDVKAVYRDIATRHFTYGKTAEVIQQVIPGLEIQQDEPTPEELAALWDRNVRMNSLPQTGISYRIDYQYKKNVESEMEVLDKSILECFRDGKLLWTVDFTNMYIEDSAYTTDGTAVWGRNKTWSSGGIARVDDEGTVMWTRFLNHGFSDEYIAAVLSNGDGTWAVISRGDYQYLCLSCYDMDGNELSFKKTEVGNLGVWNAARLGDGYIVQLGNRQSRDTALLFKLDREGNVLERFTYEGDDCEYHLTDMVEFGGKVYLSAYAVPKQDDEGRRDEIADVLDFVFSKENGGRDITGEELTPVVRDNYTAVLLLCDPFDGTTKTFYSVQGSLGGRLSVNDAGQLAWDVESITSTFFSPATNSFTIGGTCKVFRYNFDTEGILTRQVDTGETVPYRR